MWSMHAMEYYSVLKREEVLTHATAQMDLEDIMLSKRERQILYSLTYIWKLKKSQLRNRVDGGCQGLGDEAKCGGIGQRV